MRDHFANAISRNETFKLLFKNELLAESDQVIELREQYKGKYLEPVFYFPKVILSEIPIKREEHTSYCPIKGTASYWSYKDGDHCIWSYEDPLEEVSSIKGYYGFYEDKGFEIIKSPSFKPL
tara:strand:- start:184 stop:549 length:366 start_codon:yes stop_codon:yes gene_type:complete